MGIGIHSIGEKVAYKEMTFLDGDQTYTRYIPKVHVNGKFVVVGDKATKSGLMECTDPNQAISAAEKAKSELRSRLGF